MFTSLGMGRTLGDIEMLLTGQLIKEIDKVKLYNQIRKKTGVKYVFGFNSGQEAIHAALKARGVGPDHKVILPSYRCESVALAVLGSGSEPLFCNCGEDYNPDIKHILNLIDPRIKAIILPHIFGNPATINTLE